MFEDVRHHIDIETDAKPHRQHPYRAGPMAREVERKELHRMQADGVISPTNSEWAAPLIVVPKPNGGGWRVCVDYRKLNEKTVKDSYPLPRMDECLDSLGKAEFFTTLDANWGY